MKYKELSQLDYLKSQLQPTDSVIVEAGGSSKRVRLKDFPQVQMLEEQVAYGVEIDLASSDKHLKRIGNLSLHVSLPIQNRMRGCLLNDNGEVVRYLNPTSWENEVRDGTQGQVMVEIPSFYYRFYTLPEEHKYRVMISNYPVVGYAFSPMQYVSAYEASMHRPSGVLSSVVNKSKDYIGGAGWNDDKDFEDILIGCPCSGYALSGFRSAARKRKEDSTEWNCYTYNIHKVIYWLFVVEYANLNCQENFIQDLTSEGYKQGGLGDGVTTMYSKEWEGYCKYRPFVPCGTTDSLGNRTGVVDYHINKADVVDRTLSVPRYRGIENPFGHIWKWTDGILSIVHPNEDKGGSGITEVVIANNTEDYSNIGGKYVKIGNEARHDGYIKKMMLGEQGDIIPTEVGGSSNSYYCDYHYVTTMSKVEKTTTFGVLFGGLSTTGSRAGFGYANSLYSPSGSSAYVGSRLCFIPKAR